MKAAQAIIFFSILMVLGVGGAVRAQVPAMTVTVTPSSVPIPLTVVRGTIVTFQGPISQQMTMTTFALRNDYGEFTRGKFLDTWTLSWNTALEHDASEQIAVYWSRDGGPLSRLARYNVKFLEAAPFTIQAENTGGKLKVVISPTGALTAQKYQLSLDGAPTSLTADAQGNGTVDTSFFRPGSHTVGATAVMTDGSLTPIPPVSFSVPYPTRPVAVPHRKPATVPAVKHKPARPVKPRRS